MKKLALIVSIFLLVGCTTERETVISDMEPLILNVGNVRAEVTYHGENKWTYSATGIAPGNCFDMVINPKVTTGDRDQVLLNVGYSSQGSNCTGTSTQKQTSGSFEAEPTASVQIIR